jgi:sugar lactone lactonase YvrE
MNADYRDSKNKKNFLRVLVKICILFLFTFYILPPTPYLSLNISHCEESVSAPETRLAPHVLHLFDLREGIESNDRLSFPSYVCVDETNGEIYLVDSGHGRIIIYTEDGYPLYVLDEDNGVEAPAGLWIDNAGYIYLCQVKTRGEDRGRISVFDPCLRWVRDIFFKGFEGADKFRPRTVALSKEKKIYVSGDGFKGVVVLDKNEAFSHMVSPEDVSLGIKDKTDICAVYIDGSNRIYLLSEGYGHVYVYDKNENFLFRFGQKGGSTGKLSRPRGLGVDEVRHWIYVVDYLRHTVTVYKYENGQYLFEFGGKGWGPGWFQFPTYIYIDHAQRTLVADIFNQRIQVLKITALKTIKATEEKILVPGFLPVKLTPEKGER